MDKLLFWYLEGDAALNTSTLLSFAKDGLTFKTVVLISFFCRLDLYQDTTVLKSKQIMAAESIFY